MNGAVAAPGLMVVGLAHDYGRRRVVDGVSLTIERGQVHCLVGPSGCGKTTILRLIAGLLRAQTGQIMIGNRPVAGPGLDMPPERRRVGLMFQDFALFPHLCLADNVGFGLAGWSRARRERRVADLLARVGLAGRARDYPHTLSGGEQQRVALARALAPEPDLMLLDEAFSALDTTLRDVVRGQTMGLLREAGTPALLVTHDPDEAIRVGDQIHVLQHGRIVQSATPAELYARPLSAFVASFFGVVNRFRGVVRRGRLELPIGQIPAGGVAEAEPVEVIVRPEGVRLTARGRGDRIVAAVVERRDLGPVQFLTLGLPDGSRLSVRRNADSTHSAGEEVEIDLDPSHVFVYPASA